MMLQPFFVTSQPAMIEKNKTIKISITHTWTDAQYKFGL